MTTIRSLHAAGLGPYTAARRLTLAPPATQGPVQIAGPSQAGKSTALLALLLLLTGSAPDGSPFPPELINDAADRADVALVLADDRVLKRSLTRARSSTWSLSSAPQVPGDQASRAVQTYTSQAAWGQALGLDPDLVRAIVAPGEALALTRAGDRGRALRDLLLRALPAVDVAAIVAEWVGGLRPGEVAHVDDIGRGKTAVRGAASLATTARKAEATAQGAAAEAQAALAAAEGAAPAPYSPTDPSVVAEAQRKAGAARDWLAQLELYTSTQRALEVWRQADARHAEREADRAAWQARLDALGPAPDAPEAVAVPQALVDAVLAAETQVHVARQALHAAEAWQDPMVSQRRASLTLAIEAHRVAQATPTVGDCPACGTTLSTQHLELHLSRLAERVELATQALAREESESEAARERQITRAQATLTEREAIHLQARQSLDAARTRAQAAETQARDRAAHSAAVRALGPQPAPEADPGPAPVVSTPPTGHDRPDTRSRAEAAIRAATELDAQAAQGQALADAAAATHAQRVADARDRATATAAAAAAAHQAVLRAEAVLDAARRAPTEAATRAAAALDAQLTGTGVAVVWGSAAEGGPEADVLIDGRPWWCASSGRQVLADLELRVALRTLAQVRYPGPPVVGYADLPVIVDRAQDWSGRWPQVAGVWLIRTVDQAWITVSAVGGPRV
jgi:hypothetical protein